MEITKIKLKDIKPYEGNAKKHPAEQIRQIEESIREFGNNDPIAVDEGNVIIEGHGRYIALRNLGYEEAECIVLKGLTEEQKNAYRLVHNQLTMNSGWDMETLAKELSEITMDMTRFDFEIPELDDIDAVTEDEVPAERETDIKEGDMFRLGDHTLLCGDSASERDVSRLMEGTKADMMMTDPPYNVDVRNSSGMTIKNDKLGKDQFKELLNGAMGNASRSLKAGGGVLCVVRGHRGHRLQASVLWEWPGDQRMPDMGEKPFHPGEAGLPMEARAMPIRMERGVALLPGRQEPVHGDRGQDGHQEDEEGGIDKGIGGDTVPRHPDHGDTREQASQGR